MLSEVIKIDSQINKNLNTSDYNYYYKILKVYEEEINSLIKEINEDNNDNFFEELDLLNKFFIQYNEIIKNEKDYLKVLVCSLIVKNYVDITFSDEIIDNRTEINFLWESDRIINSIVKDLTNFIVWLEIFYNSNVMNKTSFNIKPRRLRLIVFELIEFFVDRGKLEKKKKWINKKSYIFYFFDIEIKNISFVKLYINKFNMYVKDNSKLFIYIDHFSNIFEFIKTNPYSNLGIDLNPNSSFINNLFEVKGMIDYELLEEFYKSKLKKNGYKEDSLFSHKKVFLEELKISISRDKKNLITIYSQKLAELDDLQRIEAILKFNYQGYFYFPISLCFRGRTYYASSISFTSYKEFRYCLYDGFYDDLNIPFHPLNSKIEKAIEPHINQLKNIKKWDFSNKSRNVKFSIMWILVSIAEIFKKDMNKEINVEDFIKKGIEILNNENYLKNLNEYDCLKINCCIKILTEINKDLYIKRYISKDATASCFQHLIKILGSANVDSLKWCNLNSLDTWFDTYSFILEKWKTNNILKHVNLFNRKNIKKPTMTIQYGATFNTCWVYFLEETDISLLTKENLSDLRLTFKDFFNFINSNVGILAKNSKEINLAIEKLNYLITLEDNTKINLIYYKLKKKQIKFQRRGIRFTKNECYTTGEKNDRKIKSSLRANYIHVQDSAVVRHVLGIRPILTIHDCFLIDYLSTTYLIAIVNEAMRIRYHDLRLNEKFKTEEIFSIFIVI